jgi:hypothetical protein
LQIEKQKNKLLQTQMMKYRRFVEETVRKNNVLDKTFYIIVPFSILELGAAKAAGSIFRKRTGLPFPKEYVFEQAKINLFPKRDHIVRQFGRLGLKIRELQTQEAIQLFYDIYNPESTEAQKLTSSEDYSTTLVQPAIEMT